MTADTELNAVSMVLEIEIHVAAHDRSQRGTEPADSTGDVLTRRTGSPNCRDSMKLINIPQKNGWKSEQQTSQFQVNRAQKSYLPTKNEISTRSPWPQTQPPAVCSDLSNGEGLDSGIIHVDFRNYEHGPEERVNETKGSGCLCIRITGTFLDCIDLRIIFSCYRKHGCHR